MNRRALDRLERLERSAGPSTLEPPEVWLCEHGVCRMTGTDGTTSLAELNARRAAGAWIIVLGLCEDHDDDATPKTREDPL